MKRRKGLPQRTAASVAKWLAAKGFGAAGEGVTYAMIVTSINEFRVSKGMLPYVGDRHGAIATFASEFVRPSKPSQTTKPKKSKKREGEKLGQIFTFFGKPNCMPQTFYWSDQWRELRYEVLKESLGCCSLCCAKPSPGKPLHVDHIKPRSKHPELELEKRNLQVLCDDCNIGKGNRDEIDWRATA